MGCCFNFIKIYTKKVQCEDLEDGYNVAHLEIKRTIIVGKKYTVLDSLFIYNK